MGLPEREGRGSVRRRVRRSTFHLPRGVRGGREGTGVGALRERLPLHLLELPAADALAGLLADRLARAVRSAGAGGLGHEVETHPLLPPFCLEPGFVALDTGPLRLYEGLA